MVEEVVEMLASAHCESIMGFHPGQYGCRTGRSAADAVGVTIAQAQDVERLRGSVNGSEGRQR